jgi:hypothetical protein
MIAAAFPVPGPLVREALMVLAVVRSGDQEIIEKLGDLGDLPRPWEPDTCSDPLRRQLWRWCEQVTIWVNHEYAWRPTGMIPACWPAHPHLARELPAPACQRLAAQEAIDVSALEEWHRYTLPTFLDRMSGRLGEGSCRDGKHVEWPAAARHAAHVDTDATDLRRRVFRDDDGPHSRPRRSTDP